MTPKKNNVYKGTRASRNPNGGFPITVNGHPLPARNDLFDHSPDGFNWGYGGSGPAQTALAILAFEYSDSFACKYHQDFKWAMIAPIRDDSFQITSAQINLWLQFSESFDDKD